MQAEGDAWIGVTTRAMGAVGTRQVRLGAIRRHRLSGQRSRVGLRCATSAALDQGRGPRSPLGRPNGPSGLPRRLLAERVWTSPRSRWRFNPTHGCPTARRSTTATSRPRARRAVRRSHRELRGVPPMEYPPMRDVDVPVIEVQPQSDVEGFSAQIGSAGIRQPRLGVGSTGGQRLHAWQVSALRTRRGAARGTVGRLRRAGFELSDVGVRAGGFAVAVRVGRGRTHPAAGRANQCWTRRGRYRRRGSIATAIRSAECGHHTSTCR